jgi:3',5'-cyclic-AMP phosphodiesterase
MLLAHISDLHSGETPGRAETLMAMARAVVDSRADFCVVTGDIADNAAPHEYRKALAPLSYIQKHMPLELVPGNHDCGVKGLWATQARYDEYHQFVARLTGEKRNAGSYPTVLDHKGFRFVGLDSTQGVLKRPWLLARGKLGTPQLEGLNAALSTDLPVVVFLHHHPFYRGLGLELTDAGPLIATLAGAYHLLLFGHKHEASVRGRMLAACKTPESRGFRLINLRTRDWRWVAF